VTFVGHISVKVNVTVRIACPIDHANSYVWRKEEGCDRLNSAGIV